MTFRTVAAALAVVAAGPAAAQGLDFDTSVVDARAASQTTTGTLSSQSRPRFVFTLRGGVAMQPEYFGSDDYRAAPDIGLYFNYARLGRFEFGDPDPFSEFRGISPRGSFRYIGARDGEDDIEGLDDVDAAYELGGGVSFRTETFRAFGMIRQGFGGHEAVVGEIGFDAYIRPSADLRIRFGPRAFFAGDDYAETYFGVSDGEAADSDFDSYSPEGGLISTGAEIQVQYRLTEAWGIEAAVTYDQYQDDAADSPIVERGQDHDWGARIGLTRAFSVGG